MFDRNGLNVLNGTATGFTLWHYRSVDPAPEILAANYFAAAAAAVGPGDFMLVNAGYGGDAPCNRLVVVDRVGTADGKPYVRVVAMVLVET
jgi:hypothetical protein